MNLDLVNHGDPHWLSPKGKIDRAGIRRKHREAYLASRTPEHKPARRTTMAKLKAVAALAKERERPKRVRNRHAQLMHALVHMSHARSQVASELKGRYGYTDSQLHSIVLSRVPGVKRATLRNTTGNAVRRLATSIKRAKP